MLGSNVPTTGGLLRCFEHAEAWGCECVQVYTTPSRTWKVPDLAASAAKSFREMCRSSGVKEVVAHVPFLVNLASSSEDIRQKSVQRLVTEAQRADELGIRYIVLHPGSCGRDNRQVGLNFIVKGLNSVLGRVSHLHTKILLENMSGQGGMLGSRFEEIAYILKNVDNSSLLGVCFDTAHAFISGYQFVGYSGYLSSLKHFDSVVGLDLIKAIHLNDAKTAHGSRNDRHAAIGEGTMGLQVFHALLRDPQFENVPKILEIPERDKKSRDSLQFLRALQTRTEQISESTHLSIQLSLGAMTDAIPD